jgi:hypothetical protein
MPTRRPADRPRRPPAGADWRLPVATVPVGRRLYRLTQTRFSDPAYFGRLVRHRFDAPDASYGVCYLGTTLACCLLEALLLAHDAAGGRRLVTLDTLQSYYAAVATLRSPLRLADLTGDGLGALGIDQRVTGGDDYDLAGAWSAAIHAHREAVDGIVYPSRHHNGRFSVALFERARDAVAFARWGVLGDRATPDLWVVLTRELRAARIDIVAFPPAPPGPTGP